VTLVLGLSKPEGIYLSADFRVTEYGTGRIVDDVSVKMLTVHYPPDRDGARALMAFTGLAVLPDGTPLGTWLRETLRGESEYPDQSMAHLRDRLNRDIAKLRTPLIVNALIIEPTRRLFGGFSNLSAAPGSVATVLREFGYVMTELDRPFAFANGSGAVRVVADKHLEKINSQLGVRPRKAADHMNLLASINRRIADRDGSVSPACHVAFLPSVVPIGGEVPEVPGFGPTSQSYTQRGESAPAVMPMLLFGIDLSSMMAQTMQQFRRMKAGEPEAPPIDTDEMNRSLRRRP
jgi:hypothetical protein